MIKQLASTFFAITGKNVYDTVDNGEFVKALGAHPNKAVVAEVFLDCIQQSTTSETISSNIDSYRAVVLRAIDTLNGDVIDFQTILNEVIGLNNGAPTSASTGSNLVVQSNTDGHSIL